jgi:general secretion pathway protein H
MRNRSRGFTLLELLVAVVIIGIVLSVTVLSISLVGDDRDVQTEAQRLMTLVELAQDEAMMQGREYGIEFVRAGYRFVEYDPLTNQWTDLIGDDTLRFRPLPENVEFELFLEDRAVALNDDPVVIESPAEDDDDDEREFGTELYAPHLLIYSSGDMTAFELTITRSTDSATIAIGGDLLGNLEILDDGNDNF